MNIKEEIAWNCPIVYLVPKDCLICSCMVIAAPLGGFIAPHVWEIVCRKNLTIFKGCHYFRFYIAISLSFQEIETKNSNLDARILIFLVLGTNHQLHITYLNVRSDHDIEAAIRGFIGSSKNAWKVSTRH